MAAIGSSRATRIGDNAPFSPVGTDPANKDNFKSVGRSPASTQRAATASWGGARNRRDRVSAFLTLRQAQNVIDAAYYAVRIGLPLNRHVTVHLEKSGVAAGDGAKAVGAYLKLHRQFLRSRGFPFAYVWVREDDDGDGSKGAHAHILMHVPPDAAPAVTRQQRRWLVRIAGRPCQRGALHTSRIGGRVRTATTSPHIYWPNLDQVLAYVLKGVTANAALVLGLRRHSEGGRIAGKRCSCSENLAAAARARIAA